jgi:cell wall-associated NlpC family hydrolase
VVQEAMRYLGVPYVYGGGSPSGFDCSGLVQFVFRKFGVSLTHYTVTQAQKGLPVSRNELKPGDVIFFGENGGSGYLYHVGIYVGNNSFIHAPHTGDVVKISKLEGKYASNFACARRYL